MVIGLNLKFLKYKKLDRKKEVADFTPPKLAASFCAALKL